MGNDEPILAGKRVVEKELERYQKKLNGPNTAKHTEAKQNWINRESKRRGRTTQENLGVRKETLRVAYEEVKILRKDLLREAASKDKNRSHIMIPESTEEIRNLEHQELNLWRGTASKRLAGWTRDGSTEEIASWSVEAERISREVEAKKRKLLEAIEKESTMKDVRMADQLLGWSGWISVVVKMQTRILQAILEWKRFAEWKESGSVKSCDRPCVSESVELERGWTVGGFNGHFPVADFDAHRLDVLLLQECFRKLDGVNVGAHEL